MIQMNPHSTLRRLPLAGSGCTAIDHLARVGLGGYLPAVAREDLVGLFGPGTVTWKVNREAVLLAGGGRALLLQVAHPLVAAGVARHSTFETEPWTRLHRTLDLVTKITFGDRRTSELASARLRGVHARVQGVAADGTAYSARDPDLLLWVWATLVDSALCVYTRCVGPLTPAEMRRYYDEQQRFAAACGVPEGHWPPSLAAFEAYRDAIVRDVLHPSEDSRRIARTVIAPRAPAPLRPAFGLVGILTVGLLPAAVRERYGFAWDPRRELLLSAATTTIRRTRAMLPAVAREFPAASSAARRARAVDAGGAAA
jgi:uncharacterized protein (DUF2236 family)